MNMLKRGLVGLALSVLAATSALGASNLPSPAFKAITLQTPLAGSSGGTGAASSAANVFLAGPLNGAAAPAAFRSIAVADLPSTVGTVQSVGLVLPSSLFTVTGTPVTTSGTFTTTLNAQAANTVLAGPTSGASTTPAFRPLTPADDPAPVDGCIRISVASSTSIAARPFNCNTLFVNGTSLTVTNVTYTMPTMTANTTYYVYATANGTNISLLAMSTGHTTGTDGREYASNGGNPNTTYRLVGMVYANTSAQLSDGVGCRCVLNYFNRTNKRASSSGSSNVGAAGTPPVALTVATPFLTWADESLAAGITGSTSVSVVGQNVQSFLYIDGVQAGTGLLTYSSTAGYSTDASAPIFVDPLTEGVHTVAEYGATSSSSASGVWVSPTHYLMTRG